MTFEEEYNCSIDPETGEKTFDIPLSGKDEEYLSIKFSNGNGKGIPGFYRAQINTEIKEKDFERILKKYADIIPVSGSKMLDINTGEEVRTADSQQNKYVEFSTGPYHNINWDKQKKELSLEVRDTNTRPLQKLLSSLSKEDEEKFEEALDEAEILIGQHLEQGS